MGEAITLSSKYQIVIPKNVRERARWKAGDKLIPVVRGRQVTLVPLRPLQELYGAAEGMKMGPIEDEEERY